MTTLQHKRPAEEAENEPCSSSSLPTQAQKRARYSSESAELVPRFRHSHQVLKPGRPKSIRLSAFKLADKPSPPLRGDDKEGHYNYELGENISSRYKILSKFGEGTFGRVLECWDRKYKDYVAVKIVRNVDKYRHAAMIELEVLNTLEKNDPESKRHCVKLKEWFQYRGHVCMVFEKLGPSLYDFLRRNEYQPLPLALVQAVAQQLLVAVAFIHELSLVHTDLKPENILLVAQDHMKLPPVPPASVERRVPRDSTIRVIDFGSATFEDGYHSSIISTRHYRAPEVILGLGWSYPCDLWSCGCILVELAAGDALFQTHENLEHLAMMQQVLGPIPEAMASHADKHSAKYFSPGPPYKLTWPEAAASRKSLRAVRRLTDLRGILSARADQSAPGSAEAVEALASLIEGLLRYDPAQRTTAVEALQHEFFRLQLEMPVGEGSTPEPAAVAAAAMQGLVPQQQYHYGALQQGPDASSAIDQQQQHQQHQQLMMMQQQHHFIQQQQQHLQQLQQQATGVSGDVAAEAVAAFQAAAAAAAAAAAGMAAAATGVDVCGSGVVGDVGLQPRAARTAAAAAAAAGGVQQLMLGQQLMQQQQHVQQLEADSGTAGLDDDDDDDDDLGDVEDDDDDERDLQEDGEYEDGEEQPMGTTEGTGEEGEGDDEDDDVDVDDDDGDEGTEGQGDGDDDDNEQQLPGSDDQYAGSDGAGGACGEYQCEQLSS